MLYREAQAQLATIYEESQQGVVARVTVDVGRPTPRRLSREERTRVHAIPGSVNAKRPRILVFRSCRPAQFQAAVQQVLSQHPSAEVFALTHEDFRDQVLAAGAHRVIAHRARRLSVFRLGPIRVRQLRQLQFDAVVVPLMEPDIYHPANLWRLAAAIDAPVVMIGADAANMRVADRTAFRALALAASAGRYEVLVTLALMARAMFLRRRQRRALVAGEPIRVLHVVPSFGIGGAQTQFAELINRTPPGEFEVAVLVLANRDDCSRHQLRRDDVPVAYLDPRDTCRKATTLVAVAEHCRRERFDIVHTWLPWSNMIGSAAAGLAGVPRIVTSVRSLNPNFSPHYKQWWHRLGDIMAARIADVVTVNAEPLIEDHARWALMPGRRIDVVHNGLAPESFGVDRRASRAWLRDSIDAPAEAALVGVVGRLAIEKDQATFVRALAALRASGVAALGVIVGDGPCEPSLRALVGELGLQDVVSFLGPRNDVRRVIAGLDLLALTSTVEGFPNVILEAGFLGVPVVSSDVGGVMDVTADRSVLFPAGDPAAAAAVMRAALADSAGTAEKAHRLQVRCRQLFTTGQMVARWTSLYREGSR